MRRIRDELGSDEEAPLLLTILAAKVPRMTVDIEKTTT
jgi:hypothetical protein